MLHLLSFCLCWLDRIWHCLVLWGRGGRGSTDVFCLEGSAARSFSGKRPTTAAAISTIACKWNQFVAKWSDFTQGLLRKVRNWGSRSSTSPSISAARATGLRWNLCRWDWKHLFTKDRWRSACRCFSHVLLWSTVDLSPYPHPEARLVRLHCKQAHLSVWYTLHTTSCGWWIKLLLSCSLTIHFIHKPKILLRQPIGWARATQKDGVLSAANEGPVVRSPPLPLAFMLPL